MADLGVQKHHKFRQCKQLEYRGKPTKLSAPLCKLFLKGQLELIGLVCLVIFTFRVWFFIFFRQVLVFALEIIYILTLPMWQSSMVTFSVLSSQESFGCGDKRSESHTRNYHQPVHCLCWEAKSPHLSAGQSSQIQYYPF